MLYETSNTLLSVSGSMESRKQTAAHKKCILYLVYESESQLLHTTTHVVKQLVIYSFATPKNRFASVYGDILVRQMTCVWVGTLNTRFQSVN